MAVATRSVCYGDHRGKAAASRGVCPRVLCAAGGSTLSSSPCKRHACPLGLCLLTAVEARASKPLSSEQGYTPSLPRPALQAEIRGVICLGELNSWSSGGNEWCLLRSPCSLNLLEEKMQK